MATKIVTKNSSTASAVPTASDLVQGELAVNVADKRLFTEDNGGSIVELGTNPSTIDINAGTIDGTTIGASSASTGAFTTLTATGAFTSRGIDDNADATAITIDSSENVGIGTSSIKSTLNLAANNSGQGAVLTLENTDTSITTNDVVGQIDFYANDGSTGGTGQKATIQAIAQNGSGTSVGLIFGTSSFPNTTATERMRIDSSGNVGIGVSSLNNPLEVGVTPNTASKTSGSAFDGAAIRLNGNLFTTNSEVSILAGADNHIQAGIGFVRESANDWGSAIKFYTRQAAVVDLDGIAERMRIDSSGRVGIGVVPEAWTYFSPVQAKRSSFAGSDGQTGVGYNWYFDGAYKYIANDYALAYQQNASSGVHSWSTAASGTADASISWSERMRIDSSGNLLVGKTAAGFANTGHELRGGGSYAAFTRDGGTPVLVNRKSSDGTLVEYMKDGTTVGSIGAGSGDLNINGPAGHSGIRFQASSILPRYNGSDTDGTMDLGYDDGTATHRWRNLHLSGGVYLGGTGAANKLDDYEEGIWTPVCGGQNMNSTGKYTKVGRMVSIILDATSHASTTPSTSITGLPFTPVTAHAAFNVGYTTSANGLTGGFLSINSGALTFVVSGGSTSITLGASERVMLTCTYVTTA